MEIGEFNEVNEALKRVMSEYQTSSRFIKEEFINLHNKLIKLLDNEIFYEDFKIGFLNAFNEIINNIKKSYLIEDKNSYHNILWKLHAVIIKDKLEKKSINPDLLPEELKVFNEFLPNRQKVFKENNVYNVITLLGEAQGHISSIKIDDKEIFVEYNDHCPSRISLLHDRLKASGWRCTNVITLKNIFPKEEGSDNYFFTAKCERQNEKIKQLAREFYLTIDCDWITIDAVTPYSLDDLQREIKFLECAYFFWDNFGIKTKDFISMMRILTKYN